MLDKFDTFLILCYNKNTNNYFALIRVIRRLPAELAGRGGLVFA